MTRTKQVGSIASFIIIGGILVLATAGILYWAAHRSNSDMITGQTPEVSLPGTTSDSSKQSTPSHNTDKQPSPDNTDTKKSNTQDNPSTNKTKKTPTSTKRSEVSSSEIPHTGPREDAITMIALGLLTAFGVAFVRSVRERVASL